MKKTIISVGLGSLMAASLATAAVAEIREAGAHYPEVREMRQTTVVGDSFNAHLAREYQELSRFETDEMYDWRDGECYAIKANAAARNEDVQPYEPTSRTYYNMETLDPDPAITAELVDAHGKLLAFLGSGVKESDPARAAHAQAMYDCWVEQQEEGHQLDHIAKCKEGFWKAITPTAHEEIARETVYFDFDSAAITSAAQGKINAFVGAMKPMADIVLYVVGHTDRAGSSAYNQKLSQERAVAVREELLRQGMDVAKIGSEKLKAKGESKPAVMTDDGVPEAKNRRVEIIAKGQVD